MKINNKLILENSKNLNILYVEDDDELRKSTTQLFLNFFNSVDTAVDGLDGLEKYKQYNEDNAYNYDLVISDISMPNMDGMKMCESIKKNCCEQAVVLITAHDEINFLHDAIYLGVNGFLTKPIDINQLQTVLYKTTQKIVDQNLLNKHYKQIEDLNILTRELTDATELSSPKDILNILIDNKENISSMWTQHKIVQEKLSKNMIDAEFFRSHYGVKVVEYFLNVIKGDAEVGNCPVIVEMLDFFKNKDLALEDIFMICVMFKNTVSAYIFEHYSFNKKLFEEISFILDKNFEGVITNYMMLKTTPIIQEEIPEVEKKVDEKEEEIEEINYREYVIESDVYELQDLEEDIDNLAIFVTMSGANSLDDFVSLGAHIERYGVILGNYPIFSELGACVIKLGVNLSNNAQLLYDDKDRMSNISALIEGFVNDLIVWRKEIFDNNIVDYRFLNSSFFSNVDTIIMFIEYDESAEFDENFDDDMFF